MFHFLGKMYLSDNQNRDTTRSYVVVDKLNEHVFAAELNCVAFASNVKELVDKYCNSDWELLARRIVRGDISEAKIVFYCDREALATLQIWLWKSIFKNVTADFCYRLYQKSYVTERLRNFYSLGLMGYERSPESIYNLIPIKRYREIYDSVNPSATLAKARADQISLEYLLANFYIPTQRQRVEEVFIKKIGAVFWENWIDNFMRIRYEIVSCAMDIDKIDPSLSSVNATNVESMIRNSPALAWISDPQFTEDNREYIQATYDPRVFSEAARRYYLGNGIEEDPYLETARVLGNKWLELLEADIQRGFGTRLVSQSFENKTNRVLVSELYNHIRTGSVNLLEEYQLNDSIQF